MAEGELGPAQSSSWPFLPRKEGWEPREAVMRMGVRQPEPPSSTLLGGRCPAGLEPVDATFHPSCSDGWGQTDGTGLGTLVMAQI